MSTLSSLDINSELVQKLYGHIVKFNYYGEKLVYQNKKVTYKDLDNHLILLTAFENLDKSQAEKIRVEEDDPQYGFISGVEDDGYAYKYVYKKETVEKKIREIFGDDATVIHESCSPADGYKRIYENGKYICYAYEGGGDVPWSNSNYQLIKAETNGDNMYLYDKYVHMVESDNIIDGINYAGTYDIYTASDREVLIAEKLDLEKAGVYDGWNSDMYWNDFEKTYMKNLFNAIKNKENTFKHTFSKDINGNYCWISTEIVD